MRGRICGCELAAGDCPEQPSLSLAKAFDRLGSTLYLIRFQNAGTMP